MKTIGLFLATKLIPAVALASIVIAIPLIFSEAARSKVRHNEKEFSAWVKLTDNPKSLTFEEWMTIRHYIKSE